ncbi:MAG: pyruvate dehydrogenase E2 component (dihydrolipoamide acetyltransferase), partial [Rhodospirillaceae bacterium]
KYNPGLKRILLPIEAWTTFVTQTIPALDKAIKEMEAVEEGVLGRVLVPEGTVAVYTPIALLLQEGEEGSVLDAVEVPEAMEKIPASPARFIAAAGPVVPSVSTPGQDDGQRIFASPLARRLAREHCIDLASLHGSGPHGRIIKADIERAMTATPVPKPVPAVHDGLPELPCERVPHTTIRKITARRTLESVRTIPHFTLAVDFEMDALLALRADLNTRLAAEAGKGADVPEERLSLNDLFIKACALALRKVPEINVSFAEEAMHCYSQVNITMLIEMASGLVAPVIRGADRKGLAEIAREMKTLMHKARAGRLRPEDCWGGTFTLSNLGMFGIRHFSAIVNPPQACILAVGAAEPRPVVRQGALAIATMMTGTLSVDHRAVDGATGARYLAVLKKLIEQPLIMLL